MSKTKARIWVFSKRKKVEKKKKTVLAIGKKLNVRGIYRKDSEHKHKGLEKEVCYSISLFAN